MELQFILTGSLLIRGHRDGLLGIFSHLDIPASSIVCDRIYEAWDNRMEERAWERFQNTVEVDYAHGASLVTTAFEQWQPHIWETWMTSTERAVRVFARGQEPYVWTHPSAKAGEAKVVSKIILP